MTSPEQIQAISDSNQRRCEQRDERVIKATAPFRARRRNSYSARSSLPGSAVQADLYQFAQGRRTQHTEACPLSDNILTLFFIIQSELSEDQRERLVSSLLPQMRPSRSEHLSSVLEAEADPRPVISLKEDDEGAAGFCPLDDEEAFWQLEDYDALVLTRFQRRALKSGKRLKGKGKRRRGRFQPFRKPQPGGKGNDSPPINPILGKERQITTVVSQRQRKTVANVRGRSRHIG